MKQSMKALLLMLLAISLLVACSPNSTQDAVSEGEAAAEAVVEQVATVAAPEPTAVPTKVPPTVPPTPEPTATDVPEPTATAEPVMLSEEDLDAAFADFLGRMTAYNTTSLEDTNLALLEDPPPFLLDVRSVAEAEEKGHIEGAVLIPLRELGQNLDQLPDFDTPLIAYCGSGWRATIAMTALEALGWEDVKVMKGGSFGGWVDAGYPVVEGAPEAGAILAVANPDPAMMAEMDGMLSAIPEGWGGITNEALNTALIENPDLMLIDVRREAEVEEKGAIDVPNEQVNIPLEEFVAMKDMWPADKDAPIAVYCGSGHRSTMAMSMLWSNGYTNVHSLKGGFGGWADAGLPVTQTANKLDVAFADFLNNMEAYNTISLEDTNLALLEDPPPFLLDVREVAEVEEKGHIESAVVIPLRELAQNLDQMPSFDTPIIAYCGSGWRATIAMTALQAMGWQDVKVMKGGSYSGWVEAGYPTVEGLPAPGMVLNAAEPDPAIVAQMDAALNAIPEGWGVITAEALNTALIENPDLILIDVRRPEELAEKGIIAADNVLAIPLEEFIERMDEWPADLDAPIVTYCGSGHRSTIAMTILLANGYTDVHSLKGGFGAWAEAEYPIAEYATP